jgi:site-specific recombinase XerD
MATDELGHHVRTFFRDYLIGQRSVSPHTVHSYRDTFSLFLVFAAARHHRPVTELSIENLGVDVLLAFLDHLERERQNTASTRNARLAALKGFYRHVAGRAPEALALCQRAASVPFKRTKAPSTTYLERSELEAVLARIDRTRPRGRRDYAMLSFFYNTGARVQEVLDVRASDLHLAAPAHVRLWGKGRKERMSPLWPQTARLLQDLLVEEGLDPRSASPVFLNRDRKPLSRFGVRYILGKYVKLAAASSPAMAAKRVHPHTMRHTTATHMAQAGVDVGRIADQLGHASTVTTNHYAKISVEMKRKALDACLPVGTESSWTKSQGLEKDLVDWLKSL